MLDPVVVDGRARFYDVAERGFAALMLGYAMVGGLLVSQALTLFTTPVICLYLDRVSDWISKWRKSAAEMKLLPAPEK